MVFQVPESKRSIDQNKFEFTVPGDEKVYRVPKAKYLTLGKMDVLSGKAEEVTIADIIDLFGEDNAEAIRTLDKDQMEALTNAWQQDSGIEMGESSASSSS